MAERPSPACLGFVKKERKRMSEALGRRRMIGAFVALLIAFCGPGLCSLAEEDEKAGEVNYAVRAILPDNQMDRQLSSFHLKVEPGQEQILQVLIVNSGEEEIMVSVEANTAFTNRNGVIEFTAASAENDRTAMDFAQMVAPVEPIVTVPANGEAVAEFLVKVSDEPFDGVIYGGLLFTKLHQDEKEDESGRFGIRNIYRYAIGVRLQQSDKTVAPEFALQSAGADNDNGALIIHLWNAQPIIARGIALSAQVYPKDGENAVASFTRSGIAMAPNSGMPYTIYFEDGLSLPEGEYRVAAELQFEGKTWFFETPLIVE